MSEEGMYETLWPYAHQSRDKNRPTWDLLFCTMRGNYWTSPGEVIGSYMILDWKESPTALRDIHFYTRYDIPIFPLLFIGVAFSRQIDRLTPYAGILRDLAELPATDKSELTVGKFTWFLHCFEHTCPDLFPGYEVYQQKREWHREMERTQRGADTHVRAKCAQLGSDVSTH